MKNRKVLGLLLSFALLLGVAIPGTLAFSTETKGSEDAMMLDGNETEATETTPVEEETVEATIADNGENESEETLPADAVAAEPDNCETTAGEQNPDVEPVCSCGTETDVHAENCLLYAAPVVPAASESGVHTGACTESCTGEGCACSCHGVSLFDRLMACTSLEELDAILQEASEEELAALTDEENRQLDQHIESLEPASLPAVVMEESNDQPVVSEIIYPTVSFTNVAPFGSPVVGGAD